MTELEETYRLLAERRMSAPVRPRSANPRYGVAAGFDLYRYDDCARVLRDPRTFSSGVHSEFVDRAMGRTILSMDDPEHKRHRDLVADVFQQRALEPFVDEHVLPACHELIDRVVAAGRADLVDELTQPLPILVTARILGLPSDDDARFRRWSLDLIEITDDFERAIVTSGQLRDYFLALVRERRQRPGGDVISRLVTTEVDGARLDDEAICSFLRLLLPAGIETTSRSIPALLRRLLAHPDQLAELRADRSLLPAAIEEGLRYDAPVLMILRIATLDAEIGGVAVPAGSVVALHLGAANRDERRWPEPDRFDIHREPQQHLSFAVGPHMCLGLHLARLETAAAVSAVLDRMPGLRLDPGRPAPRWTVGSNGMPVLDSLPVLFGP